MRISVVMLTYNRAHMMGGMIRDVLRQSYSDFEYLIINNGSTDETNALLEQYEKLDDRIRIITLENALSVGAARNIGVREARGEFIAFVDDDDSISTCFLSNLVDIADTYHAGVAVSGAMEIENGIARRQFDFDDIVVMDPEEACEELIRRRRIRVGFSGKLIRRDLFLRFPIKEDCKHEDIHTTHKYLAYAGKVAVDGHPEQKFIRHSGNLSSFRSNYAAMSPAQLREYWDAYRERAAWLTEQYPDNVDLWEYSVWSFAISMCKRYEGGELRECETEYLEMRDHLATDTERVLECKHISADESGYVRNSIKKKER